MKSQKLRKDRLLAELVRLNVVLRSGLSNGELEIVADEFWRQFSGTTERYFFQAVAEYSKKSRWFPKPAEIREHLDQILANLPAPTDRLLAAPTELSDEQIRINKEGIARIKQQLARAKGVLKQERGHREKVRRQAKDISTGVLVIE